MKEVVGQLLANLHWFILIYGLYGGWTMYEEHDVQLEEITSRSIELDSEIIRNEKKIKEIQDFGKKTEEYKTRVEEVAKNIELAQKQLPSETNDSQIMTYLQQELSNLNIFDIQITPGSEEVATYFVSKEYSINSSGTFLQFLVFLEKLALADRIYNVKNLILLSEKGKNRGRYQILNASGIIKAYRFNPDFKVDRGFK